MDNKMYCTNCGAEMDPNASICVKCGVNKGKVKNIVLIVANQSVKNKTSAQTVAHNFQIGSIFLRVKTLLRI